MCQSLRAIDFSIGQALQLRDWWLVEKIVDFCVLLEDEIFLSPELMHGQHAHTYLSPTIHKQILLNLVLFCLIIDCCLSSSMSFCPHTCVSVV